MRRIAALLVIINICVFNLSAQSTKGKFDAGKMKIEWLVIENGHNNKTASLTALSFTNGSKAALPAQGWTIYFNFARPIESSSVTGNVKIEHVNGDLFKLSPTQDFKGVQPSGKVRIEFVSSDWVVNFTDAPAGFFIVWDGDSKAIALNEVTVLPSTEPKQYLRFPGDKIGLVGPADIFKQNETITDIAANELPKIFPTPKHYRETGDFYTIDASVKIAADDIFKKEATFLSAALGKILGKQPAIIGINETGGIRLQQKAMSLDAYELQVSKAGIVIYAAGNTGVFYAIQSLQSLFPPLSWSAQQKNIAVPGVEVSDAPRFGYRAYFLDVARHFQPKKEILKMIDLMTLYKLNVLHLHLTEDEGWRIEIPSIPELTTVGSKRGFSVKKGEMLPPSFGSGPDVNNPYASGYYSKKDFIEILKYASERHIEVIPEIETPGHARAAIVSMGARYEKYKQAGNMLEAEKYLLHDINDSSVYSSAQYWNDNVMNVSLPSVYRFIETVVGDIKTMYKEAGAPLNTIHMGGDEVPAGVWEKSPACKALIAREPALQNIDDLWYYYYGKVNRILQSRGLFVSGWEEAGMRKTSLDGEKKMIANPDFGKAHFQVDVWNNVLGWGAEDLAYQLANAGYKVVLSCVSNNYFDMAYYKSFDEPWLLLGWLY
jgi:hexosaminidase